MKESTLLRTLPSIFISGMFVVEPFEG